MQECSQKALCLIGCVMRGQNPLPFFALIKQASTAKTVSLMLQVSLTQNRGVGAQYPQGDSVCTALIAHQPLIGISIASTQAVIHMQCAQASTAPGSFSHAELQQAS